jgi:hypothetical protein
MKTIKVTLVLVLAVSLLAATGCKEKPSQAPAPKTTEEVAAAAPKTEVPTSTTTTTTSVAKSEAPAVPVPAASAPAAPAPVLGFDASKSLDQVKADASKMDLAQLTTAAMACKEVYTAKQLDLAKVAEQLKNIPLTEKLGTEAQQLTGEAKNLQDACNNIQAQLAVYLDKLKGMGADTTSMQVK